MDGLTASAQAGGAGPKALGGMDPTKHQLDDELQRKARSAMGSSSRTKARGVRTREYQFGTTVE